MPRGQRKHTPLPPVAQLYLGALEVALDAGRHPEERAGAGRLMREFGDEIKARRPPRAARTEYRYDIAVANGERRPERASRSDPELWDAVPIALDHRICGDS